MCASGPGSHSIRLISAHAESPPRKHTSAAHSATKDPLRALPFSRSRTIIASRTMSPTGYATLTMWPSNPIVGSDAAGRTMKIQASRLIPVVSVVASTTAGQLRCGVRRRMSRISPAAVAGYRDR